MIWPYTESTGDPVQIIQQWCLCEMITQYNLGYPHVLGQKAHVMITERSGKLWWKYPVKVINVNLKLYLDNWGLDKWSCTVYVSHSRELAMMANYSSILKCNYSKVTEKKTTHPQHFAIVIQSTQEAEPIIIHYHLSVQTSLHHIQS